MLISKEMEIQDVLRIRSDTAGPRVVMFSGVHGNEVSGIHAVEKVLFDFFGGKRSLKRGSLTLARANEEAIAVERRYVKHNMNRMFREDYGPEIDRTAYEFRRTQELKRVLKNCDYFFDLHSAPTADEAFLVAEEHAVDFFSALKLPRIVTGWSKFSAGALGGDAENYANSCGAISATLESGSHFDKISNDVAYKSVISVLTVLDMITSEESSASGQSEVFEMYSVVTKESEDFRYAGETTNFQLLKQNETFAFQDG